MSNTDNNCTTAVITGATTGVAGSVTAVSVAGTVTGLSAAGITSGLAAIGATVGGGMVAGLAITAAAPLIAAGGGYCAYKKWFRDK